MAFTQAVIAGKEPKDSLREVVSMLRSTSNPQKEYIIRIMKKFIKENAHQFGGVLGD